MADPGQNQRIPLTYAAALAGATLIISRSSLNYRNRPRGSWAGLTFDEHIVMACAENLAYDSRRVTQWLQRKKAHLISTKCVEFSLFIRHSCNPKEGFANQAQLRIGTLPTVTVIPNQH